MTMATVQRFRRTDRQLAAWAAFVSIAFGMSIVNAHAALPEPEPEQDPIIAARAPIPSLAPLVEEVAPAVVNITASYRPPVDDFFAREFENTGSGVIVDAEEGYILTNYHVIEGANEIIVVLQDYRVLTARVVGTDPQSDLAVLQVSGGDLQTLPLGDSDSMRVGDYVVAIGNPFGLRHTVTSGIISATGRANVSNDNDSFQDFIQTDASINPGNSGGALINLYGELIGINSAIYAQRGGNTGIGFSIPINMALGVLEQILEFGEVRRPRLGVGINPVTPVVARDLNLPAARGALVQDVHANSTAERAGILKNDVILSINGRRTDDPQGLRATIGMLRIGTVVEIELIRGGDRIILVAELQGETSVESVASVGEIVVPESIFEGATLTSFDASQPSYFSDGGVLVTQVSAGSLAAMQGLRAGDIVLRVNDSRVRNLEEFLQVLGALDEIGRLILAVQRADEMLLLTIR